MGRWAQARHRGRGGPASTVAFPLPAPTDSEWHTVSAGFSATVVMDAPCPGAATTVAVQKRMQPSAVWIDADECGCLDSQGEVFEAEEGEVWDFRVAWSNGVINLSDWSTVLSQEIAA